MELIIAEKPKAALRIALALGNFVKKNFFGVPYYEIKNKEIVVASAVGHLFGLAERKASKAESEGESEEESGESKAENKGWPSFDVEWRPTPLISKQKYASKYINALKQFKPDEITIACDYDVEGELIGYNVLRFIFKREAKDAYRMKFSTLTKPELLDAYENKLRHIDFNEAIAGETRHILDWIYGINLSRALMQSTERRKILSIGRVQGPALALLAKRELEINAFKPETFWKVFIAVKDDSNNEAILEYKDRIKQRQELEQFKMLEGKHVKLEIKKEEKSIWPLAPFNLTELQMESYRLFKIDPARTLAIAQELYLAGLISYPRTSSQKLPFTIGYKTILQKLSHHFDVSLAKRSRPVEGKQTDPAHPAIFPTGEFANLKGEEKAIYELIVRRFIACFCQDAILEIKNVKANINAKEFEKNFKRVKEKGWLEVYPYQIEQEWTEIGEDSIILKVLPEEKQTQPPPRYNPATLVRELEKRNLGTKGTRAQIIETLYKRGYIKERVIKVTPLGMAVVSFLEKISSLILDEALTRKFELEMDKILISKDPLEEEQKIINEAKGILLKIAQDYEKNKSKLKEMLIEAIARLNKETIEEKKVFNCSCGGSLILKRSKAGNYFIGCTNWPNCKIAYGLPKGRITKSKSVCVCNWPKLKLWVAGRKNFELCFNPNCNEFWVKKMNQAIEKKELKEKKRKDEKRKKTKKRKKKGKKKEE